MNKEHKYKSTVKWTGNSGQGTANYRAYSRDYTISAESKPDIPGSSDPSFLGDKEKYNPEDMLVASLSACHMLWYLHLCAEAGIIVTDYIDNAVGTMEVAESGTGKFKVVTLNPTVSIRTKSMVDKAGQLHQRAHELCYIARSVNFPVVHKPIIVVVSEM
jgi:organic hydroperoxide reductase OsmC/OhrA